MKKRISIIIILALIIILLVTFFYKNSKENISLKSQIDNSKEITLMDYREMGEDYTEEIYEKFDSVKFGNLKSGFLNLNNESIEWIILEKNGDKALLMTKYIIDCKAFDYVDIENIDYISDEIKSTYPNITWETCSLRKWLNNEFINNSFSNGEKEKILTMHLEDENTDDKIFCLSESEYIKYFDNGGYYEKDRNIGDTHIYYNGATIRNKKAYSYDIYQMIPENDTYNYWLRNKGINGAEQGIVVGSTKTVNFFGGISSAINTNVFTGVRPAMWVSID